MKRGDTSRTSPGGEAVDDLGPGPRPRASDSPPFEPGWATPSTLEHPLGPRPDPELGGPHLRELILSSLFAGAASRPQIGRFTLLRLLGEGGMGVVYTAYDEDLDRRVAIKLLRADAASRPDMFRARMLREARLMAQLSHANVVTVHEVGEHEGRVFIAMEFVRGEPLDAWIAAHRGREGESDWRGVVALFAQAGAGLVAAHRAGLVHRDFKPQNVMVRSDGVVKVLDFGLACATPQDGLSLVAADGSDRSALAREAVTQTGAVMGTPAYMAPEQHLGLAADERSDQFSFCVALYEALYGQHPFGGSTLAALRAAVLAGRIRDAPPGSPVPLRIRRLLARGLAARPDERHPSLAELLAALVDDPVAVRRRWLAVGGLVLAASTGSYVLASRGAETEQPCAAVAGELAEVWNQERRIAVAAAVEATGLPFAEATWQRVAPAIDAYARDWTAMRAESCLAHVEALESDRHYDLRTACLVRRRAALDTLVSALALAKPGDVENMAQAVSALPPLAPCSDTEALAAALPPPEDPSVARAVEAHRAALAQADAYEALGRHEEARALVAPVLDSPEVKAYMPLEAEAWLSLGTVELTALRYGAAVEALTQALETSLRAGHLMVAAEAFARRIFVQGQTGKAQEAIQDVPLARALVEWSRDEQLRWLLLNNTGMTYYALGQFAEAQEHTLAALETKERIGDLDFEYAVTLGNLGVVALGRGDLRAAREYLVRALESDEGALGTNHPRVALSRLGLAVVELYGGRHDAALGGMRAAVAALVRVHGPSSEVLLNCYLQLADLSNRRGAYAETLEYTDQAAAIRATHDLEGDPILVNLFIHRAVALEGLGRHEEAMAELAAGLAVVEAGPGPAGAAAWIHDAAGRISLQRGEAEAALGALRRARAVHESSPGTAPYVLAVEDIRIGTALRAAGDLDAALDLASRGLARLLDTPQRHYVEMLAELRLGVGDILLDAGRLDEAREQYETARRELAATAEPHNPWLARLEFATARALRKGSAAERSRAEALAYGALGSLRRFTPGFEPEAEAIERFLREEFGNSSGRPN
ncbi:protein kinase domain-containing protein [Nannocystis exedens]|uniref:protein kinase domain-containing protein n=1 Tax=Nannocystis exedens TaxID=54 RepID=UPI000BC59A23|nr:protein kinase [Nannocystis exedens]PCC68567.1 Serine/threonine-protein kinase PknA [Nannocystis exedens]